MIGDTELREILRATAEHAELPTVMPESMRRKVTLRRARTIGVTFLLTVAIAVGGLQGMRAVTFDEAAPQPPASRRDVAESEVASLIDPSIENLIPDSPAPSVPYVINLDTREMTPLPDAIVGSLATGRGVDRSWGNPRNDPPIRFAVSPDGSSLAFVGEGEDGTPQIFIAAIDGTDVRQVTHDPRQATSPAWSPDGTTIAYEDGIGSDANVFVLDIATGESRQITPENPLCLSCMEPQFTPDGSSMISLGGNNECCNATEMWTVPVAGGRSTLLIGPDEGLGGIGSVSMSPDGSLVTFLAGGTFESGRIRYCGPCRFLANADGTDKRVIRFGYASASGAWSPDGTRIVLSEDGGGIRVIDVVTGETARVAEGRAAVWVDDHTLLVEV
ncbi:MAG: TolB family protein [Actinomycetota bacterium]